LYREWKSSLITAQFSTFQAEKSAQERDLKRLRGQANQIDQMASKRESMVVKSRDSLAVGLKSTRNALSSLHAALRNKSLQLEKTAFELRMMQVRGRFV
jgi:hypothetical protein